MLVLLQCLSALKYLHARNPPVVHRDIKPGNILVQSRYPDHIHVKLGDFGLSRDSCDLSTICGCQIYLAPEIYENCDYINSGGRERKSYTAAVDVWSLGVVVYELVCCLPRYSTWYQGGGTAWCQKIVSKLEKDLQIGSDQLKRFLLSVMMVISPELRSSAQECYDRALHLPCATDDGGKSPRLIPHADEVEQTPLQHCTREHIAGGQQTVLWRGTRPPESAFWNSCQYANEYEQAASRAMHDLAGGGGGGEGGELVQDGKRSRCSADEVSGFSGELSRWARSDAPSPQIHASTSGLRQKRPTGGFTSSSSEVRHSKRVDHHNKRISDGKEQRPIHPEAWNSIPRNQPRGEFQALQVHGPLRGCVSDRQAGHDWPTQETIETATLLQALSQAPPSNTAVQHHDADSKFSLAGLST